jgi:hypothetical protein
MGRAQSQDALQVACDDCGMAGTATPYPMIWTVDPVPGTTLPHLLYGVLRACGSDASTAWDTVATARPFVDPWQPSLDAAERWLPRRAAH